MDPIVIDCRCAGKHPDGDSVVLREKLSFEAGMTLVVLTGEDVSDPIEAAAKGARVATAMVMHGVLSWNVVDAAGKPILPHPQSVRAWLGDEFDASIVPLLNAAFTQYQGTVMRPLDQTSSASPGDGRTARSTSRSSPTSRTRRS